MWKKNYYRNLAFLLEFSTLTTAETKKNYVLKFVKIIIYLISIICLKQNYIFDNLHSPQFSISHNIYDINSQKYYIWEIEIISN